MNLSIARLLPVLLLAAAVLGLAAAPASAQVGTVEGVILQTDGSPAAFVDVRLEGTTNAVEEVALTGEDGTYQFPGVAVGTYTLSVFSEGRVFERAVDVEVVPGGTKRVTLREIASQTTEVVEVDARIADIVDIRETDTSSTLSGEFISKIPTQNKRIQDFVFLFPGVVRSGSSDSTDISIAGGSSSQIGYRLNGISINDPVSGGASLDVPAAAIQSFKLITAGFTAEHGEQSTGIAEIVTKAGTNTVDFGYSVDFKSTDLAQSIPALDDSNAFVDAILRGDDTLLESDIERGFRLLGIDPVSTTDDDNNPVPRYRIRHSVSAGGPIVRDKAWFHTTLEALADDYGGAFVQGEFDNDQLLWTSKVNWNVWESGIASNKLELTANVDNDETTGAAFAAASPSTANNVSSTVWTLAATDIHIFDETTVLETKVSATHFYATSRPQDVRTGVGTEFIVPLPPGGFLNWTGGASTTNADTTTDVLRMESSLTKDVGNHTLKGGVLYQTTDFESYDERGTTLVDFRVSDDRNFIQGPQAVFGRAITSGPPTRTTNTAWQAALFLQDTWQITDNLTVDLGLRADYQSFVQEMFPAPRIGFSLDPIGDGRTRLFGNWGIFHDVLLAQALEHAQRPVQFWDRIRFANEFQDRRFGQISVLDIYKEALSTPPNSSGEDVVAWLVPEIEQSYVLSDGLSAPTNRDWSIGIERQLPGNVRMQVSYRNAERSHQVRNDVRTVSVPMFEGEYEKREVVFETTGTGQFRQWAVEFQRPFGTQWEANLSYVQSKNTGPIAPPATPLDPNDVFYVQGTLGNDRTHVVKLQGRGFLFPKRGKLDVSADFTWQTGLPESAEIITSDGQTILPIGRNTLRLPSTRQLNFGLQREWKTMDDKLAIVGRLNVSNLFNELNVTGAYGRFQVPGGGADPLAFPPLRPALLVTDVDVSRSAELSLSINF